MDQTKKLIKSNILLDIYIDIAPPNMILIRPFALQSF